MTAASIANDGEFADIVWSEDGCAPLIVRVHKPATREEFIAALLFAAMELHRDQGPLDKPRVISSTDEFRHLAFVPWRAEPQAAKS